MNILAKTITASVIALAGQGAYAMDRITEACQLAIAIQTETPIDQLTLKNVQSFPELSPPRVQFRALRGDTNKTVESVLDDIFASRSSDEDGLVNLGTVKCEFASNVSPVGLSYFFCTDNSCPLIEIDKRTQEMRVLLERAGY